MEIGMDVEKQVKDRYSEAAQHVSEALCCPVNYDTNLLKLLPKEIIERDYGCGDPSRYIKKGETVLDLGSGGGKICYMAAQLVGEGGRVIGVDMNDDMLNLARSYQSSMADTLGEDRVHFFKGRIQDLGLDLDTVADYLSNNPVSDLKSADLFSHWQEKQRQQNPMIADNSVDLVISNCVLNLVDDRHKRQLIHEIYRVTKPGGRVAISDIVSDAPIPQHLKDNPELWSGCLSGAFEELAFIEVFQEAGFIGVTYDKWDTQPWQTIENIEFRSVTLTAVKRPTDSTQTDVGHAVLYRGPFSEVKDELGNRFPVGQRTSVSEQVFQRLSESTFKDQFIFLTPSKRMDPKPFTLPPATPRSPTLTRGSIQIGAGECCPTSSCC